MTSRSVRIAVLASFNLELLRRSLSESLSKSAIASDLYFSEYGRWETDCIDQQSALYEFQPDVVILFADTADLLPSLTPDDMLPRQTDRQKFGAHCWQRFESAITGILKGLQSATIFVHNLAPSRINPLGTLEDNAGYCARAAVEFVNDQLRSLTEQNPRVRAIDYSGLVLEHGYALLSDSRLWHLGRMRLSRKGLEFLAGLYTRYLSALLVPRRKCLVLDLDNTLWGGVLGEEGPDGIVIGHEGLGLAFREFQFAIMALAQRGVILAIASKNNPSDVWEVLDNHPEMILRRSDFACVEIHWEAKSESLARIAQKLNLGLDSLVFWDDEPREREIVRTQHPLVLVPEVPADPSSYAEALLNLECFDVLSLTEEDRRRGEMYSQEASRQQWLSNSAPSNLSDFYRSLNMSVSVRTPDTYGVQRFAQLTQRTNQFNFTTHRYIEAELQAMLQDPAYRLYTLTLADRFGDLGIVGAAVVQWNDPNWELETFLMSCRALGRGVEEAFIAALLSELPDTGRAGASVRGKFIPTKKNAPARLFLERLKAPLIAAGDGSFDFELDPQIIVFPPWILRIK